MKIDLPIIAKKNDKDLIPQYHPLHHSAFLSHVKSGLDALEKMVELKGEQVKEQERGAGHGLKALYESWLSKMLSGTWKVGMCPWRPSRSGFSWMSMPVR